MVFPLNMHTETTQLGRIKPSNKDQDIKWAPSSLAVVRLPQ